MLKIVTHNGNFHADEVLAIALLELLADVCGDVTRTRDEAILEQAKACSKTYVLDVGGEHDGGRLNFDHHQREFTGVNDSGTKQSTFGLIVDHLKETVCLQYGNFVNAKLRNFAVIVDNHDNGVVKSDILKWISDFNHLGGDLDDVFHVTLDTARTWLAAMLNGWVKEAEQASVIQKGLDTMTPSGVIVLDAFAPVDERFNTAKAGMVVVTPRPDGNWQIQSLNKGVEKDFSMRSPAPEEWRGNRDFTTARGNPVVFCHATGFLTVTVTRETAIAVANEIIEWNKTTQ